MNLIKIIMSLNPAIHCFFFLYHDAGIGLCSLFRLFRNASVFFLLAELAGTVLLSFNYHCSWKIQKWLEG